MASQDWSGWQDWLDAWNRRDLDAVLSLYADDVSFTSNAVVSLGVDGSGSIRGKAALRQVFAAGLRAYPDLHFRPLHAFVGPKGRALHYFGIQRRHVIEIHEVDAQEKIIVASAYHGPLPEG